MVHMIMRVGILMGMVVMLCRVALMRGCRAGHFIVTSMMVYCIRPLKGGTKGNSVEMEQILDNTTSEKQQSSTRYALERNGIG